VPRPGGATRHPCACVVEVHGTTASCGGCWVQELHADTAAHQDLSVFQLSAWCRRSDLIPPAVDLFVPDPVATDQGPLFEKEGLLYPNRLWVAAGSSGWCSPPPSLSAEPKQGRHHRRHGRHLHSLPQHPSSECEPLARALVHARLGPLDGHVEAANSPSADRVPLAFNVMAPKLLRLVTCPPCRFPR
jgi:hypothetical protein